MEVWGSGNALREFLYVDDLAAASIYLLQLSKAEYRRHSQPMMSHINVGSGIEVSIKELAVAISETVGFKGEIVFDRSKPDGTPANC